MTRKTWKIRKQNIIFVTQKIGKGGKGGRVPQEV